MDIQGLADMIRQSSYLNAGGQPEGQRGVDKLNASFGNINNIIKQVLEIKKAKLENQKSAYQQAPIGQSFGVPSASQEAGMNATRVPENIYPQPQAIGPETQQGNLPMAVPQPPSQPALFNTRQQFQDKYKISPDMPAFMAPEIMKMVALGNATDLYANPHDFTDVSITPDFVHTYKIPQKQGLNLGSKNPMMTNLTGQQALDRGQTPKNTNIITPLQQGISPYAEARLKMTAENKVPSEMPQTSVPGSAAMLLQRGAKAESLIANPIKSPQRISLVATDIAGMLQQGAPQLDAIKGAGFSNTLLQKISMYRQNLLSKPEGIDVPEIRKELFDIVQDLKSASLPSIQQQLQHIETWYPDQLPPNWEQEKRRELGLDRPVISFNPGGNSVTSPKSGGVLHQDAQGNKAWVYPDGTFDEVK